MADMENFYDDLIIINLYEIAKLLFSDQTDIKKHAPHNKVLKRGAKGLSHVRTSHIAHITVCRLSATNC